MNTNEYNFFFHFIVKVRAMNINLKSEIIITDILQTKVHLFLEINLHVVTVKKTKNCTFVQRLLMQHS